MDHLAIFCFSCKTEVEAIHSFMQQIFIEHLLSMSYLHWGYNGEEKVSFSQGLTDQWQSVKKIGKYSIMWCCENSTGKHGVQSEE